jgi:hypothetical protein
MRRLFLPEGNNVIVPNIFPGPVFFPFLFFIAQKPVSSRVFFCKMFDIGRRDQCAEAFQG